ncbi:MAG: hypothetical protein JOZ12_15055 [Sinobacteraceae bacterium]|nr:hypothetical protein [Nevskiaceae bacterium]
MEAFFDFDTSPGEEPQPPDNQMGRVGRVMDMARGGEDVLGSCFRFRYERSWEEYYNRAGLPAAQAEMIWRHSLGTIAMDVPLLLAFLLLLGTRSGLPQMVREQAGVNRRRCSIGKPPLLDHIEVRAPILPEYREIRASPPGGFRRHPRLHRVRGHLVRRGSQIFWRVPHLRGRASAGVIRSQTVIWTFDEAGRRLPTGEQLPKGRLC